jgi:hypothetical protein
MRRTFPKGESGNPKGRPKGIPNKITTSVKEDVLEVYQNLGGKLGLEKWARLSTRNLSTFYGWMMSKLLPASLEVGGQDGGPVRVQLEKVITSIDPNGSNASGE